MVLGYDEPRPKKENYDSFLKRFVSGLEIFRQKEMSFMVYGSYVRGDADFGRSDIDALLVFPNDVIINKGVLRQVSRIYANAQEGNNIPFQINPSDLRTLEEGRFNSYDSNFEPYFMEEGKIFYGPDFRKRIKFELPEMSDQNQLRFNLRKVRAYLLFSEFDRRKNDAQFIERFNKILNAASRGSKQIMGLVDGKLRKNRFSRLEEISEVFPEVDVSVLKEIRTIYKNTRLLDEIYRNPEEVSRLSFSAVTFFEQMIKAYLDANPRSQE